MIFRKIGDKIYPIQLVPKTRIEARITKMQARLAKLPDGARKNLLSIRIAKFQSAIASTIDNKVEIDSGLSKEEATYMATIIQEKINRLPDNTPTKIEAQANLISIQTEIAKVDALTINEIQVE